MALTVRQKIKSICYFATHPNSLKMIISFKEFGYLKDEGWFQALQKKIPVNENGEPIPWFTYSFIDFLKVKLKKEIRIIEFGSGQSTLFLAKYVKEVVSVETNKFWYERMKKVIPWNVNLLLLDPKSQQFNEITFTGDSKFDVVIVDSENRNGILKASISKLNSNGVIILDDSERPEYEDGIDVLVNNGFKRLDFWGISPGYFYKKCTSIFYQINNCFDI